MNWLWFGIGYFISVIFTIIFNAIIYLYRVYRIAGKENHCNYCEASVLELEAMYCPKCGRRLTLHRENPNFKEENGIYFDEEGFHGHNEIVFERAYERKNSVFVESKKEGLTKVLVDEQVPEKIVNNE